MVLRALEHSKDRTSNTEIGLACPVLLRLDLTHHNFRVENPYTFTIHIIMTLHELCIPPTLRGGGWRVPQFHFSSLTPLPQFHLERSGDKQPCDDYTHASLHHKQQHVSQFYALFQPGIVQREDRPGKQCVTRGTASRVMWAGFVVSASAWICVVHEQKTWQTKHAEL